MPRSVRVAVIIAGAVWCAGSAFICMVLPPQPRATVDTPRLWMAGFSPDGQSFFTHGAMPWPQVEVRNTADGRVRSKINVEYEAAGPATLSPDGQYLAYPARIRTKVDGLPEHAKTNVVVADSATGRARHYLDSANWPIAFSPDSRRVATGDDRRMGCFLMWDLTDNAKLLGYVAVSTGPILSLEFSPDGRQFLAIGNQDTGYTSLLRTYYQSQSPPLQLPSSSLLPHGGAIWWNTDNWQKTGEVANVTNSMMGTSASFVCADRIAVVRNDLPRAAKIFDPKSGEEQLTFPIPDGASNLVPNVTGAGLVGVLYFRTDFVAKALEMIPTGGPPTRRIYLPSTMLYDARTGAVRAQLPVEPSQACLSPDGRTLVAWDDGHLTIWDVPPSRFTLIWFALSAVLGVVIALFTRWFTRWLRRVHAYGAVSPRSKFVSTGAS